ncbi:MAG: GGDEF domain-containing protein [Thermomicrobiales bacterium]|jgi:diguanylate cyclase (GGDEF)-like protein|nr:diguanylate cyclase [Thermomicrobiales bacterium]
MPDLVNPAAISSPWEDAASGLGTLPALVRQLDAALQPPLAPPTPLTLLQLALTPPDAASGTLDEPAVVAAVVALLRVVVAVHPATRAARLEATAFRLQGHEFALLLPDTSDDQARSVAMALLGLHDVTGWVCHAGGVVVTPGLATLAQTLLLAESALRAARAGDEVVLYDSSVAVAEEVDRVIARLARETLTQGRRAAWAGEVALRDPVTGLPNQRALHQFLAIEIPRAQRHRHPFALLLVDGDNLKEYNAQYGYAGGDAWIAAIGQLLTRETRASDLVVRWRSGDEFMVALPETARPQARLLAERIRAKVEQELAQPSLAGTVSIGVAAFPADGQTAATLLAVAEASAAQAKQAGKNRVACATTSGAADPTPPATP